MRITFGDYIVDVDVDRTRNTYRTVEIGGAESCRCSYCLNYLAAISGGLPKEMLQFLSEAGIDARKDAEVYEQGEVSPGIRSYGGEYYFWGSIISEPKREKIFENDLRVEFTKPSPLAQDAFRSEGALCFCFTVNLPWLLKDESA